MVAWFPVAFLCCPTSLTCDPWHQQVISLHTTASHRIFSPDIFFSLGNIRYDANVVRNVRTCSSNNRVHRVQNPFNPPSFPILLQLWTSASRLCRTRDWLISHLSYQATLQSKMTRFCLQMVTVEPTVSVCVWMLDRLLRSVLWWTGNLPRVLCTVTAVLGSCDTKCRINSDGK